MSTPSAREEFIQGCEQELARMEKTYGINLSVNDEKQLRRETTFCFRYGMARLLDQLKNEAQDNLIVDASGTYSREALLARVNEMAEGIKTHTTQDTYQGEFELESMRGLALRDACRTMREHLERLLSARA